MNWIDGPRACSLTGYGGLVLMAQITLDDNERWNVYNFDQSTGGEIRSGGYPTLLQAKTVAEKVAVRKEVPTT
jgi:hypothetical protein